MPKIKVMGNPWWLQREFEKYKEEHFKENKEMYVYTTEEQEEVLRAYSRWRTRAEFKETCQDIRLGISPTKAAKIAALTGGKNDFVFDGVVDAGDSHCSLGHAIRYEFYARSESTGTEIVFGSTCASDFFHLEKGQLNRLNKVKDRMVEEIQYLLFVTYTDRFQIYRNTFYPDLAKLAGGEENLKFFRQVCGNETVKYIYEFCKLGLPLSPYLLNKIAIYRKKHLKKTIEDIFIEGNSSELLEHFKKIDSSGWYTRGETYISETLFGREGMLNYEAYTNIRLLGLDYIVTKNLDLCKEMQDVLWPDSLIKKIPIYYIKDEYGRSRRATYDEVENKSKGLEIMHTTLVPEDMVFGIIGAIMIAGTGPGISTAERRSLIAKLMMENSNQQLGEAVEIPQKANTEESYAILLDAYSQDIMNAIVSMGKHTNKVREYMDSLEKEVKAQTETPIIRAQKTQGETFTHERVSDDNKSEQDVPWDTSDAVQVNTAENEETELQKKLAPVYATLKSNIKIVDNPAIKNMLTSKHIKTYKDLTEKQAKYMIDVYNRLADQGKLSGTRVTVDETEQHVITSSIKKTSNNPYIVIQFDMNNKNAMIIECADGRTRKYYVLKDVDNMLPNSFSPTGFTTQPTILTYAIASNADRFKSKFNVTNIEDIYEAGIEANKKMTGGRGRWPKYADIMNYMGIQESDVKEMIDSVAGQRVDPANTQIYKMLERCVVLELIYYNLKNTSEV